MSYSDRMKPRQHLYKVKYAKGQYRPTKADFYIIDRWGNIYEFDEVEKDGAKAFSLSLPSYKKYFVEAGRFGYFAILNQINLYDKDIVIKDW